MQKSHICTFLSDTRRRYLALTKALLASSGFQGHRVKPVYLVSFLLPDCTLCPGFPQNQCIGLALASASRHLLPGPCRMRCCCLWWLHLQGLFLVPVWPQAGTPALLHGLEQRACDSRAILGSLWQKKCNIIVKKTAGG